MAEPGTKDFDTIKAVVKRLREQNAARNTKFETREKMYRLELTNEPSGDLVKLLFDPLPHTVVELVKRIYGFNEPMISVPPPSEAETVRAAAAKVERFLKAVYYASRGPRALQDLLVSLTVYDEETLFIDPWGLEDDEAATPFILTVRNPKFCDVDYGERDRVLAHVYHAKVRLPQLRDSYGEANVKFLGDDEAKEYDLVDYVDKAKRCAYVEQAADKPIQLKSHTWNFVPRQAGLGNAPTFMERPEDRRMGMLFALEAAHLWEASCLNLTLANSNTFAFLNPQWVKKSKNIEKDKGMQINLRETGKVHLIRTDEELEVLAKQLIDKAQMELLTQINSMEEAATMPKIMAGMSPFAGITASATHTMSTNARLIAQPIANCAARAFEETFDMILRMVKEYKKPVQVWGVDGVVEIAASDILAIGERVRVKVELRPDVSMERQVTMQMAAMLKNIGVGYDTLFSLLEGAGIIPDAEQARQDMLISRFIDLYMKDFAAQAAQEAGLEIKAGGQMGMPGTVGTTPGETLPGTPAQSEEMGGMPMGLGNALAAAPGAKNMPSLEELNGLAR